jgi:hypothetical protein
MLVAGSGKRNAHDDDYRQIAPNAPASAGVPGRAYFSGCEARAVMRSVASWADSRCYADLCVRRRRENAGFRCAVVRNGDADWTITCRDGRRVVKGHSSI